MGSSSAPRMFLVACETVNSDSCVRSIRAVLKTALEKMLTARNRMIARTIEPIE